MHCAAVLPDRLAAYFQKPDGARQGGIRMSRLNVWPWLRPFLILVLVISIPPLVYWFGYVQSSVTAAKRQGYSTLSAVTADFRARVEAHDRIADNAEEYARGDVYTSQQLRLLQAYLSSLLKSKSQLVPADAKASHLEVGRQSGGLLVNVGAIANAELCKPVPSPCSVQTVLQLENLIPWSVVETEFDGLLLLTEENQLLAQDRRLPVQPLAVPIPLQVGGAPADLKNIFAGESLGQKGGQPAKSGDGGRRRSLFEFHDDASVQLAGVDYVAFLQAVSIPVSARAGSKNDVPTDATLSPKVDAATSPTIRVVVCGLIARERLRREAIQLSPQTLIVVGSLVALGLFAIPFLKLRFIGERERIQQRDIWLLTGSILSATALLTLLMLDVHATSMLRTSFDKGLKQFTRSIVGNLESETAKALGELHSSAPELLADPSLKITPKSDGIRCNDKNPAVTPAPPIGAILTQRDFHSYPNFEAIVETDLCGNQIRKWMSRTIPTPYINNSTQPYFSPALTRHPQVPADDFVFRATVASTTGLLLGVYAVPVASDTRQLGAEVEPSMRTGLVSIGTPMRSVSDPIIARPFQFVLVDRRGEVTFQKTQGSFRGERFFESVRGGESLARAARFPDRDPQNYQYRGKSYRMRSVDIPALQLTLVTYYENEVIGSLAARICSTAAVFTLGIVGSMLLGCAISMLAFDSAFDWAWPSASRTGHYAVGIGICGLAMLALLLARRFIDSDWLRWLILATPFLVIVLLGTGWVTRWVESVLKIVRRDGYRLIGVRSVAARDADAAGDADKSLWLMPLMFEGFAVMALVTFIAWPALVVFNDAFNLHSVAYATETSNSWNAARVRWDDANTESVVNVGSAFKELDCIRHPDLRCSVPEPTYASARNYSALLEQRRELALYKECAPLVGQKCSTELSPQAPLSFTAGVARWLAVFGRDGAEHAGTLFQIAESQKGAPRTPLLSGFRWWSIGGPILLLGVLWLLVRSVARHVLGIEVTEARVLDEREELKQCTGTNWLLLRPSQVTLSNLSGPIERVDLRSASLQKAFTSPEEGGTLLIEHLETRLCDKAWRDALLSLLGAKSPGCVIVTSEIDPLHYLTQRVREKSEYIRSLPAEEKEEKEKRAEVEKACVELRNELANWAVALRSVRKLREAAPVFPASRPHDRCCRHHAKLAEECRSEALIQIGTRLLHRSDLNSYHWDDIVGFVLDAAEPYYRSVWELCSRQERLVLIQLAQVGLVNPKREDIVRRLARRGLVIVDPRYRLMNESFKRFVCAAEPQERVTEWERTSAKMSWSRLGTPLYALAAMVVAVLLFAEQEFFTNLLAVAAGGAATLGSLRSIYASVTKPAAGTSKA
jgi:hypothetical protein